jgi:hypothetical protein
MLTPTQKDLVWARQRLNQVVLKAIYESLPDEKARQGFLQRLAAQKLAAQQKTGNAPPEQTA